MTEDAVSMYLSGEFTEAESQELISDVEDCIPGFSIKFSGLRDRPDMAASVFVFMTAGVVIAGGALFLRSFITGAGEEAGRKFAEGLWGVFGKSKEKSIGYLNRNQLEEILALPQGEQQDFARRKMGGHPPPVEIIIREIEVDGLPDAQFIFKFPYELTYEEFIEAVQALGENYISTLQRLIDEDFNRDGFTLSSKITAIYDRDSRMWIGGKKHVEKLYQSRSEETVRRIREAARNRNTPNIFKD